MKINEAEQILGMTKKNIRFYEQQGLLKPSRNSSNGYREYSDEDIDALRKIKLLRKLGIPIEEIKKLQAHYLTFEDCLHRHLIALERERKNMENIEAFCHGLLAEDISLESLPADKLLKDIENMEEGGARFMDKQKGDKALRKNAVIAAVIVIAIMLIPMIAAIGVWITVDFPLIFVVLFTVVPLITIISILIALKERFKEIKGGEWNEASKY